MSQTGKQSEPRKTTQHQNRLTDHKLQQDDFERVKKVVEQATDIRQERVEAAKLALKQGKLNLEGNDLAEKILSDPLNQVDVEI